MAQYTRLTKEQRDLVEKILQGEKNMPSPFSRDTTLPKEMIPYDPNYLDSLKFRKGLEDFEDYRQNRITFPESETPTFENANRSPYSLGESRDIKNMMGSPSPSSSPSPTTNRLPTSTASPAPSVVAEMSIPEMIEIAKSYGVSPERVYQNGLDVMGSPLSNKEEVESLFQNATPYIPEPTDEEFIKELGERDRSFYYPKIKSKVK